MSRMLKHPSFSEDSLGDEIESSLNWLKEIGSAANDERLKMLFYIEDRASALKNAAASRFAGASETCRKVLPRLNVPLAEELDALVGMEDSVCTHLLVGLPIVGEPPPSPFFDPDDMPATQSISDLMKTAKERREKIVASMKVTPDKVTPEIEDFIEE